MIKFFLFILALNSGAAHALPSLYDQLQFETDRLAITPLCEHHAQALQAIDESDESFVHISDTGKEHQTISQALNAQEAFLKEHNVFSRETMMDLTELFYGIFLKNTEDLIGCFKLSIHPDHFISGGVKVSKDYQNKGYATEVSLKGMQHFAQQGLIPSKDHTDTPWHGFSGMVHLKNKSSLAFNLKCGFLIGAFAGDAVNLYYPKVIENPNPLSYQTGDPALHNQVIELFKEYLKPSVPENEKIAEHSLSKLSFQRLVNVPEKFLNEAINEEIWFIIRALADNVISLSDIPNHVQNTIFATIKSQKSEIKIDPIIEIPESFKKPLRQIDAVIKMIETFEQQ